MVVLYAIGGLVLIAVGVVSLINPRFLFELTESWKHNGGVDEPSKQYLIESKVRGVMFVMAGICGLVLPFLS